MKRKIHSLLIAHLCLASPQALAADGDMVWSGWLGIGYRSVNDNARDPSKLNEYRDLDATALGSFEVRGRGNNYYLNAFGENLGRDDQYLDLRGGQYGVFKYQVYDNEMRHNFGSGIGALTPYAGVGSATLTSTFPRLNPGDWNSFDNSYNRKDFGGMFEYSGTSPWYFRVDTNEVRRSGVKVIAGAQGTSPGNGFMDLPSPVDYRTRNIALEAGYASRRGLLAVSWLTSKFSNGNDVLRWSNGFFAPTAPESYDNTVLPVDNELTRISLNGNLRQLPGGSTLAGRVTYSKLTSSVSILANMLGAANSYRATASSSPEYRGEVINKTAALSFTSHPMTNLDTRLYWSSARKDNHSTELVFNPDATSGLRCSNAPCVPELFSYKKDNVGVEAGYRFSPRNRITAGYDYYDMERVRIDFNANKDKKFYVEWKSSALDTVDTRVKYQYLERRSNHLGSTGIDAFVRRFDLANVDQDLFKVVLDASPAPLLDFGFEAIYKQNDYKDTILGRTSDERQEFYLSVGYGDPKTFRVMLFGDWEETRYDSLHRVGSGNPDPSAPPSGTPFTNTYTWAARNKDRSWQAGFGADWIPDDRWVVKASLTWDKTRGNADFTTQEGAVLAAPVLPISNFDNTNRTSLHVKATYRMSKTWDLGGGYAYERYRFSDIGFDCPDPGIASQPACPNVVNTVPPGGAATSYLTGQSAYQNYKANIVYLLATFRF